MGRPAVSLPISQLVLGRTTPPWNGEAWHVERVDADADVLRVTFRGGCSFLCSPQALPASDVTLSYTIRVSDGFRWARGWLPGLVIGSRESPREASCRLAWHAHGRLSASVRLPRDARQGREYYRQSSNGNNELLGGEGLCLKRGRWNTVVLRVRLNGFDDFQRPVQDGVLTVCVNGVMSTVSGIVWRRTFRAAVSHVAVTIECSRCAQGSHVEFGDFSLTL